MIINPVIVTITNSKLHVVATTVIDYDLQEVVAQALKEPCEKNQWSFKFYTPPTLPVFFDTIKERPV